MKLSLKSSILIIYALVFSSLALPSYSNPIGGFIAVAGGKFILDFVGGFASKMGEAAAEALTEKYPPTPPTGEKRVYKGQDGGYLTYEYIGNQGASPVYRVISNGFQDNDSEFRGQFT
jgi:hypothetical protein